MFAHSHIKTHLLHKYAYEPGSVETNTFPVLHFWGKHYLEFTLYHDIHRFFTMEDTLSLLHTALHSLCCSLTLTTQYSKLTVSV